MVPAKITDIRNAITFAEAGKLYPRPCGPATVARHALGNGLRGVILESWLSGGRRVTTPEAVEDFLRRVNEASNATRVIAGAAAQSEETAANGREAKKALEGILGGQSA